MTSVKTIHYSYLEITYLQTISSVFVVLPLVTPDNVCPLLGFIYWPLQINVPSMKNIRHVSTLRYRAFYVIGLWALMTSMTCDLHQNQCGFFLNVINICTQYEKYLLSWDIVVTTWASQKTYLHTHIHTNTNMTPKRSLMIDDTINEGHFVCLFTYLHFDEVYFMIHCPPDISMNYLLLLTVFKEIFPFSWPFIASFSQR